MQYMLLLYATESGCSELAPAEQDRWMAEFRDYHLALENEGVLRGVNRLQPSSTVVTVRVTGGSPKVTDGPFAEAKELLGGYFLSTFPSATTPWPGRHAAREPSSARSKCDR